MFVKVLCARQSAGNVGKCGTLEKKLPVDKKTILLFSRKIPNLLTTEASKHDT